MKRNFIISDINSFIDDIVLYINGDLIDRGRESGEILLDIINRINTNHKSFSIVYLTGNHEVLNVSVIL